MESVAVETLPQMDTLAALCKAAADPLRMAILRVLRTESFGVQELTAMFDTIQSGMSHHLKVLARAGLVATRREGTFVFYRRPLLSATDPFRLWKQGLFTTLDALPIPEDVAARIGEIRQERDRSSLSFFDRNAPRFKEKQDLIIRFDQYAYCLDELLEAAALPAHARVLEVGPGTGEFLLALGTRFGAVHVLDSSEEMLAETRRNLAATPEGRLLDARIVYRHGALQEITWGTPLDLIVLNMVLHHIASPGEAFAACARNLAPGGVLLIADLNPHSQTWVRDLCGDLWLGFEPEELTYWAEAAGLCEEQSLYQGLKNGFGLQMRLYRKPASGVGHDR